MSQKRKGGGRRRAALGQSEPHRLCISCRKSLLQDQLIRFVRAPDGALAMDVTGKMNQRGAWTCPDAGCMQNAIAKGRFLQAFSAPVLATMEALMEQVFSVLKGEVLRAMGLARNAGILTAGRTEVLAVMAQGKATYVLLANDLAVRSRTEILAATTQEETLTGLSKHEMGSAVGRKPTGVLALQGLTPLSNRIASNLKRLGGLLESCREQEESRSKTDRVNGGHLDTAEPDTARRPPS